MHLWPNKSIIKSAKKNNVKEILAKRPKGITDEVWNLIVSDHKLNKLIVLDTVPKESKKIVKQSDRK